MRCAPAIQPSTRVIMVNFPHNPTGYLPDAGTFESVVDIAREAGAYLLSDEVYRFLEHDPADRLPAAADLYDKALSLGVMSKSFALAGLRIGWLASRDGELLRRVTTFKDYTTICNSAPAEILALIALRAREAVLARSLAMIEDNPPRRPFLLGLVRNLRVEPATGSLADDGVMLLPGSVYGHGDNHFRLGFGRKDFPEALERLERFAKRRLYQS